MTSERLDIHAHELGYDPVYIVGTRAALRALSVAIELALSWRRPEAARAIAQDGDEYAVVVVPVPELIASDPRELLSAADHARLFEKRRP